METWVYLLVNRSYSTNSSVQDAFLQNRLCPHMGTNEKQILTLDLA